MVTDAMLPPSANGRSWMTDSVVTPLLGNRCAWNMTLLDFVTLAHTHHEVTMVAEKRRTEVVPNHRRRRPLGPLLALSTIFLHLAHFVLSYRM